MNQEEILEEYFLISMEPHASPYLLLSQTGVLFSADLGFRLSISDIQLQSSRNQKTYIFLKIKAQIHEIFGNEYSHIESLEAVGSFAQIYHFLVNQFESFLSKKGLNILLF